MFVQEDEEMLPENSDSRVSSLFKDDSLSEDSSYADQTPNSVTLKRREKINEVLYSLLNNENFQKYDKLKYVLENMDDNSQETLTGIWAVILETVFKENTEFNFRVDKEWVMKLAALIHYQFNYDYLEE